MTHDGYTDEEHDEIVELMTDLPGEFFGNHGDWEVTVSKLNDLITLKESRANYAPGSVNPPDLPEARFIGSTNHGERYGSVNITMPPMKFEEEF